MSRRLISIVCARDCKVLGSLLLAALPPIPCPPICHVLVMLTTLHFQSAPTSLQLRTNRANRSRSCARPGATIANSSYVSTLHLIIFSFQSLSSRLQLEWIANRLALAACKCLVAPAAVKGLPLTQQVSTLAASPRLSYQPRLGSGLHSRMVDVNERIRASRLGSASAKTPWFSFC